MDSQSTFFRPGGTLEPGAECYIARKADEQLLTALLAGDYVFLLDSRQKGKSSLIARSILKLREAGVRQVKLDLQRIGANVTPEQWYAGLAVGVGQELGLQKQILEYWKERQSVGPLARFIGALQDVILPNTTEPLVIFVDEVDFVRALTFPTDEFFAAIRESFNRRSSDESFKRLTFCLVGVATPGQLIRNPDISPFNIGVRIDLTDFTLEETLVYSASLNGKRDGAKLVARVHHWVSGHPYLTQLLCGRIANDPGVVTTADVDRLVRTLFLSPESRQREPNLSDVERRMLDPDVPGLAREESRVQVLELYGRMLRARPVEAVEQNPVVATLRLSGVGLEHDGILQVRNRVYRTVFDETWRQQNLPDAEVRRQRNAVRNAILKTSSVAAVVLLFVGAAAYGMWRLADERQRALRQLQEQSVLLERQSYAGLMASISLALSEQRYVRSSQLVDGSKDNPLRGWEWGHAAMYTSRFEMDVADLPKTLGVLEPQADGSLFLNSPLGIYEVSAGGIKLRQESPNNDVAPRFRRGDWRIGDSPISGETVFIKVGESTPKWSIKTKYRMFDADPDSEAILATQGGDNETPFALLSVRSGKPIAEILGPSFTIAGRFLPDGTLLTVHQAGHLRRWDRRGKELAAAEMGVVEMRSFGKMALSDDGSKFVFYDRRYRRLEIRSTPDLKVIATTQGPLRSANSCAFSRDGTKLVVGGWDGVVYVFDSQSGVLLDSFAGHRGPVAMVEFLGRDQHLASVDIGARMLLWSLDSRKPVETYPVHPGQAESAQLIKGGPAVLSSGGGWQGEQVLSSLDMQTGKVSKVGGWRSYQLGTDSVYLSMVDGTVSKLDLSLKPVNRVEVFDADMGEVYLVANGTRLLVKRYRGLGDPTSKYALLDANSLKEISRFELPWPEGTNVDEYVSWSSTGEVVAISAIRRDAETSTVKLDGTIHMVSGSDGRLLGSLQTDRPFTAVAMTPDGRYVVAALHESGKYEITPTLFEAGSLKKAGELAKSAFIDRFEFGPNGRHLAGYKVDGRGFLWDFESKKRVATIAPGTLIRELRFSPDGERIITSSLNRDTKIWSTIHQDELMTLRYDPTRNEDQNGDLVTDSSRFSEDGSKVIMACTDGCVRIFNSIPWKAQARADAKKGP